MMSSLAERLTTDAHSILVSDLNRWGNRLAPQHSTALALLLSDFTAMACGDLSGRWAWGLPTGAGKSASVVAWITALSNLGSEGEGISVAVSASKIEALCEMKRSLLAHGVSAEDISLVHSYQFNPKRALAGHTGFATEPSDKGKDRRFVLVSHSRVQGSSSEFMKHKGKQRDLLIWDESLLTSQATGLSVSEIRGAVGWFSGYYAESDQHQELINHLGLLRSTISESLAALSQDQDSCIISVPHHPQSESWIPMVAPLDMASPILSLLEMGGKPARLVKAGGNGLLSYQVSVPESFGCIVVLDASWPIRTLERLDHTISDAAIRHPGLPEILRDMKQFNRVTIHHMAKPGGRTSMSAEFTHRLHTKGSVRSIVDVIKAIPPDEAVLIYTYKTRGGSRSVDFGRVLTDALEREGIDTSAPATGQLGFAFDAPRKRVNFQTWGSECGLNSFSHCRHVILAGIMHRSHVDLLASVIGQANDLSAKISTDLFRAVDVGERAHLGYQALSRGACRVVDQGEAARMEAYIIDRAPDFESTLSKVMPGAHWKKWDDGSLDKGQVGKVAEAVRSFLQSFQRDSISISSMRKSLGLLAVKSDTFTAGISKALSSLPAWARQNRSLAKLSFAEG